jgi:hypothetical protein
MKAVVFAVSAFFILTVGGNLNAAETVPPSNYKLPPARSLIGKWKTPFYVKFYTQMDSSRGVFEDVATEKRIITWIITKGPNDNTVNIRQTYRRKEFTLLDPDVAVPPSPGESPFLVGKISGTRLTVKSWTGEKFGSFTFTTDHMAGTWDYTTTVGIYKVDRIYTKRKELKLVKK